MVGLARITCQNSISKTKLQHVCFPLFLESLDVGATENLLKRFIAAGILRRVFAKAMVVLDQQSLLLQKITEVASLSVVGGMSVIELSGCGGA